MFLLNLQECSGMLSNHMHNQLGLIVVKQNTEREKLKNNYFSL